MVSEPTPAGTVDHIAIEVSNLDARIDWMVENLGLVLRRIGRLSSDPSRRIALLADRRGFKLELIEAPPGSPGRDDIVRHAAVRVEDVAAETSRLIEAGASEVRPPHRFEPARSWTSVIRPPHGIDVQLVRYDEDSPDR